LLDGEKGAWWAARAGFERADPAPDHELGDACKGLWFRTICPALTLSERRGRVLTGCAGRVASIEWSLDGREGG
jgi:hypothetical protein